jgi:hypothetical protein
MSTSLDREYNIYLRHLKEFAANHLDEYVLIKDSKVIDFYKSYLDALKAGLKSFGNVPFLIKEIRKTEEVHFFHQGISSS